MKYISSGIFRKSTDYDDIAIEVNLKSSSHKKNPFLHHSNNSNNSSNSNSANSSISSIETTNHHLSRRKIMKHQRSGSGGSSTHHYGSYSRLSSSRNNNSDDRRVVRSLSPTRKNSNKSNSDIQNRPLSPESALRWRKNHNHRSGSNQSFFPQSSSTSATTTTTTTTIPTSVSTNESESNCTVRGHYEIGTLVPSMSPNRSLRRRPAHLTSPIAEEEEEERDENFVSTTTTTATEAVPVTEAISYDSEGDDSCSEDGDISIDDDINDENIVHDVKLTAVVWKRKKGLSSKLKSGYSKAKAAPSSLGSKLSRLSGKDASHNRPDSTSKWEQRRIVLDGRYLMYYDKNMEILETHEDEAGATSPSGGGGGGGEDPSSSNSPKGKLKPLPFTTRIARKISNSTNESARSYSAVNTPRGVINATRATTSFSAIKHAPTPYGLTITPKSLSDWKWDLCFESRKELFKWQSSLMEVSLGKSVQSYKKEQGEYYSDNDQVAVCERDDVNPPFRNQVKDKNRIEGKSKVQGTSKIIPHQAESGRNDNYLSTVFLIPSRDIYVVGVIVNLSLMYLWYLSFTQQSILASYLYVTLVVNGGAYMIFHNTTKNVQRNTEYITQKMEDDDLSIDEDQSDTSHINASSKFENDSKASLLPSIPLLEQDTTSRNLDQENLAPHSGYKPIAGESTIKLLNPNASNRNIDGHPTVGWYPSPPKHTIIRGAKYLTDNKKIPSPGSLYELVKVDAFKSREHSLEVSKRFDISQIHTPIGGNESTTTATKTWKAPDTFVISFALPTSTPKLGRANSDKKGYITTGYYRMKKETRDILSVITSPNYDPSKDDAELEGRLNNTTKQIINGVKLWEQWCRLAPSDESWQARLKFIAKGDNLREVGAPKWICNYNGKPILIKRAGVTGFLFSYDNIMEYDLSLHPFPYLFKSAMSYLKEHLFPKMLMTFSFVIEGRSEDELPEIIIGDGLQLCYINDDYISTAEDVFEKST